MTFAPRDCQACSVPYSPRSRTQRYCEECRTVTLVCSVCECPFDVLRTELAKRPCRYCSPACKARESGGLYLNQGRWQIVCRDGTKMLYSRAVVAARIGRLLRSEELVHHRNEDTTDDRDENLELTNASEHVAHHWRVRKAAAA